MVQYIEKVCIHCGLYASTFVPTTRCETQYHTFPSLGLNCVKPRDTSQETKEAYTIRLTGMSFVAES